MPTSFLENKTVLIISPQSWSSLQISKYHYAIELSKKNNQVLFLNPPDYGLSSKFNIYQDTNHPNITILTFKPFFPFLTFLRFKIRFLYDILMTFQVKMIITFIKQPIDVLWCFEPNLYLNLKIFNSKYIIYHPVDFIEKWHQIKPALSADIVLSVSESILNKFSSISLKKAVINHGLAIPFEKMARQNLNQSIEYRQNNPVQIGYIGNLLIQSLDHPMFLNIISNNPEIKFHFWGSGFDSIDPFINSIKTKKNVILHGYKSPELISTEIQKMDGFVIFYKKVENVYDRSNSHKILEYLSTGKVIISNEISTYKLVPNLLVTPENDNDTLLPALFNKVIKNLDYFNSSALKKTRILYALNNTYQKQIERIETLITSI